MRTLWRHLLPRIRKLKEKYETHARDSSAYVLYDAPTL